MARRRTTALAVAASGVLLAALSAPAAAIGSPAPIPGYAPVAPVESATVPRSEELQFEVQAQPHLQRVQLVASAQPTLDPQTGTLAQDSWVMPLWLFPGGVAMAEPATLPGSYFFTAYASAWPFLITPGTYYWQVTASSSDGAGSNPQLLVGPVHELTITGPSQAGPAPVSRQGAMWGGATGMGFPGQRTPIAFRLAADSQSISDVTYAGVQICFGIPDVYEPIGGRSTDAAPLSPDGSFALLTQRVYPATPNRAPGRTTLLNLAGTVGAGEARGTLTEDSGRDCRGQAGWSATPAVAGATSQNLPVVALAAQRDRIGRLMLVWRSNCVRSQVTNPKSWETLWLDLAGVRLDRRTGAFRVRRVFKLRNPEGDVFRVNGDLRGKLRNGLGGSFRARAHNITPLHDGISEKQTERCDSGTVRFNVSR